MKRFLTMAAILGLSSLALNVMAQQAQSTQDQTGATQRQEQAADTQSARAFQGKIKKSGDKLVLQDSATSQAYVLDDQDKAKQFEGKKVKVIATMDPNTSMLHVVDITSAEK